MRKTREEIVRKLRMVVCLALCLSFLSVALWAQQDGTVNGKITDPSGLFCPVSELRSQALSYWAASE